MDTSNHIKESVDFDEAYQAIPDEVQTFIASDQYNLILLGISDALKLSPEQIEELRYTSYEVLLQTLNLEGAAEALVESKLFDKELAAKAIFALDQEIMSRVQTLLDEAQTQDIEEAPSAATPEQSAPSPHDVLARLNESFTKPQQTIPQKRDYGVTKTPQAPTTPKAPDPYREIPQ